ncbi:unnamed protein product [Closterium sp. NIES-53]
MDDEDPRDQDINDFALAAQGEDRGVPRSESVCPPSIGGACALGTGVLEDRQGDFECLAAAVPRFASMVLACEGDPDAPDIPNPRSYAEAIMGPYSSQWHAAMDAEMASWKSTGTYVNEVPSPGANIVDGMWIFRRDYELHSLDFSTSFLQGSLHEEIWLRRPLGFSGSFPAGTQWSLRRPVYGLCQAPREWHNTLRTTLAAVGFTLSTADPSLFLRTDMSLPPFYVLVYDDDLVFATADTEALTLVKSELQKRHTCTNLAPPSDESVEPSGPYPELVGCLMYLMTCTRPDLAYPLCILARYVAPERHRPEHWEAAKRVLRYLCSMSGMGLMLGGRGPVVLTGHADASWELRWLTFLLTDLGERPHSSPVLPRAALAHEPASHPVSPIRTARRNPRSRPPPVPGTHAMAFCPSSVPLRVPLSAPLESSLPEVPHPESDRACTASPTISRLLATAFTDPSFESAAVSALVAKLLDFAAACRLDYATALVTESAQEDFECLSAAEPRFASMLLAPEGDPDAPDIPTPRSYAEAITGPYSSQWQGAMDAKMASLKSTGTNVDAVPPSRANKVEGMWIFKVKQLPGSPPAFKARYIARSFRQRQGVAYFRSSSNEAEIYAGAMAAQELYWLTYLLTGRAASFASSSPRGQLRLAYMATRANTDDILSKALPPCDHQRFSTVLGLVPTLPHLLSA